MCGRYNFTAEDAEEIQRMTREIQERLNEQLKTGEIYPTNLVPILIQDKGCEKPMPMTWGFPHFKGGGVIINARSETVTEKRMFRNSVLTRRCIVPSTGFFEWRREGSSKIKYLFRLPGEKVLYMAGFYNRFPTKDGEERDQFVILTTGANESMQDVHDRMPVILRPEERTVWLSDCVDFDKIFDRHSVTMEHMPA